MGNAWQDNTYLITARNWALDGLFTTMFSNVGPSDELVYGGLLERMWTIPRCDWFFELLECDWTTCTDCLSVNDNIVIVVGIVVVLDQDLLLGGSFLRWRLGNLRCRCLRLCRRCSFCCLCLGGGFGLYESASTSRTAATERATDLDGCVVLLRVGNVVDVKRLSL